MTKDKYGEAIGIWHLTVGGADLELKPQLGDNRTFIKLMMGKESKEDKSILYDKFADFILSIIRTNHPPKDDKEKEKQELYVDYNLMELFDETMVRFRWTTKEELEKSKKEALGKQIKKLTESG